MATCGYLCPACEGKKIKEDGADCDWCGEIANKKAISTKELNEWIENVHQGPCCSDVEGEKKNK
jgi:hypothetical protein